MQTQANSSERTTNAEERPDTDTDTDKEYLLSPLRSGDADKTEVSPRLDAPSAAPKSPRGTSLRADWQLPDDWKAWAERERPDLDAALVAESFRDYWIAKPGKDGRKVDWQATWRNWVRNQRSAAGLPAARRQADGLGRFV